MSEECYNDGDLNCLELAFSQCWGLAEKKKRWKSLALTDSVDLIKELKCQSYC